MAGIFSRIDGEEEFNSIYNEMRRLNLSVFKHAFEVSRNNVKFDAFNPKSLSLISVDVVKTAVDNKNFNALGEAYGTLLGIFERIVDSKEFKLLEYADLLCFAIAELKKMPGFSFDTLKKKFSKIKLSKANLIAGNPPTVTVNQSYLKMVETNTLKILEVLK